MYQAKRAGGGVWVARPGQVDFQPVEPVAVVTAGEIAGEIAP